MALMRMGITRVTTAAIVGGGHDHQHRWGCGWRGSGAHVVLRADQAKCLGDVVDVGDKRPIIVDGVDANVDINVDLVTEVRCASLMRSLRQTLLALCKAAGVAVPTYTWE